jgi:hypothetical protein
MEGQIRSGDVILPRPDDRSYAAERWADAVMAIVDCPRDLTTLEAWARHTGIGQGTLRVWCRAAQVRPKSALDFGRLLRAVVRARPGPVWDLPSLLEIVDGRTLGALLARSGLSGEATRGVPPTVEAFLGRQTLVRTELAVEAVRRRLASGRRSLAAMGR